jgi:hypothetical protein
LQSLTDIAESKILKTDEKAGGNYPFRDPMFKINIDFNDDASGEDELESTPLEYFPLPEVSDPKPEDFQDFNILSHPFIVEFDDPEDAENDMKRQAAEFDTTRDFTKRVVANIEKKWLTLTPNIEVFLDQIQRILTEGMNCLHSFERWSKHLEMKQYSSVLEEWDDQIGEENEALDSNFLNPEEWIEPEMKNENINTIKSLFEVAFTRANGYLSKFHKFLQLFWEYKNLNYDIFTNPDLAKPSITMTCVFNVLEYHKTMFETKIPFQADLGLLRLESNGLKSKLTPVPMQIYKQVSGLIPPEMQHRNALLKDWFNNSISELKLTTTDIDMFVEQNRALKQIEKDQPQYKEKLKVVGELYDVFKQFHIEVKKDDTAAYGEVKTAETNLQTEINRANENISKNQEIFSKDIKNNLMKQLEKDVVELESLVMDKKYLTADAPMAEVIKELETHNELLMKYEADFKRYQSYEDVLGLPISRLEALTNLKDDLYVRLLLWKSTKEWDQNIIEWNETMFSQIDVDQIQSLCDKYARHVSKCKKKIPITNEILLKLEQKVKEFSTTMPVVVALRNKQLKENHLQNIKDIIGVDFDLQQLALKD